jgi:hypothetical protein
MQYRRYPGARPRAPSRTSGTMAGPSLNGNVDGAPEVLGLAAMRRSREFEAPADDGAV